MRARSVTFFPLDQSEIETPLNKIQKIIDEQLAFNELLARQIVNSNGDEILTIFLSFFINLSDISIRQSLAPERVPILKREVLKLILGDIKNYNALKSTISNFADLDYLFLHIHSLREGAVLGLMKTATDLTTLKDVLSYAFSGTELEKQSKKVIQGIKSMRLKSPIMSDVNTFKEMINILKPEISASCLRYVEDYEFELGNLNGSEVLKILPARDVKPKQKRLEEQANVLSKKNVPYLELRLLTRNYSEQVQNMNMSFISCPIYEKFNERYFILFDTAKKLYEAEEKLREKMRELSALLAVQEQLSETSVPIVGMEDVQSTISPSVSKKPVPSNSVKPVNETLPVSLIDSKNTIIHEILPEQNAIDLPQASYPVTSEIPDEPKDDIDHAEILHSTQDEVEPDYTSYHRQFSKKPKETEQRDPVKRNRLELSTTEQDIFLKVFGLRDYETINLRALVSLACDGFNATMTTTGANRCRIEIKNIYATLLMPATVLQTEPSNQCQKATVTMHGGGHRSKKSLNNDKGNTPSYLINQFRAAFERAGFTPENLGLENQASLSVVDF